MIPKIIHYCWFGNNEKSSFIKKCISSWSKKLKDYQIKEWNDENINELIKGIDSKFLKDAIKEEKYAFISDYIRLLALQKYGGIYLDTDVLVYKNFDPFLKDNLFLGLISDWSIGTAVIGSIKENQILKYWLDYLDKFYLESNEFVANNHWMTKYFLENYKGFTLNGQKMNLSNEIAIYPKHYFEAEKPFYIKGGGICTHMCLGSWIEAKQNEKINPLKKLFRSITPKFILKIKNYREHCISSKSND